jgi:hypothetical protein
LTANGSIKTTWSVSSIYDFESFEKKNHFTEIPLGDFTLILPDGLSEYIRVKDLDRSLEFFTDILGLVETRRKEYEQGRLTLVFLGPRGVKSLLDSYQ